MGDVAKGIKSFKRAWHLMQQMSQNLKIFPKIIKILKTKVNHMPTIGWFEILIIVAIAIIVLGPKDFPVMLKKVGSWVGSQKNILTIFKMKFLKSI